MFRITAVCCAAVLVACSPSEEQTSQEEAGMAMSGGIALADVAGTWDVKAMPEGSDSVVSESQMVLTDTMDGWTLLLPERDPIPMRVIAVAGDSIVAEAGPFQSVLREGVMVSIRSVSRLHGEMLMGQITARYQTTEADSVVVLRTEGTRHQM